jgi:uncharacterized protein
MLRFAGGGGMDRPRAVESGGAGLFEEDVGSGRDSAGEDLPPVASFLTLQEIQGIFRLAISEDRLVAYLSAEKEIPEGIEPFHVREMLQAEGICFGIAGDQEIHMFLASAGALVWKVAEGQAPEPGRDPEIKYYFDTDPLKIGMIKEGGIIDYRDRGDIPQVKKGVLLAEKIPGETGKEGRDLYDRILPAPLPAQVKLRCGKGIERSEDGLKAFAKVDGRPEISSTGEVFVSPVLKISGDVDLKTGHVDFEGHVEVAGAVQDGFRVSAARLRAREIVKAEVLVSGDVVVSGGIIGSNVKAEGSIQAKYLHDSHVEAVGNLQIQKEIRDSEVEISGTCMMEFGRILSSHVSARKGIRAMEIGSGSSRPCILSVGLDDRVKREKKRIRKGMTQRQEARDNLLLLLDSLGKKSRDLNKSVGDLAQVQDRAIVQQRMILEKISELEKNSGGAPPEKAQEALKYLQSKIDETGANLDGMLNEQELVVQEVQKAKSRILVLEKENEQLQANLETLSRWSDEEKSIAAVKVSGTIFPGVTIKSPHASVILREKYEKVLVREVLTPSGGESKWKVRVSPLK